MTSRSAIQASGWLARGGVAAVFAVAAWPKVLDPAAFGAAIDNYHLLPSALTQVVAVGLPYLELVIAVALLVPPLMRGASLLSMLLLGVFALAMVQAIVRGIDLSCGCFGNGAELEVSWWSVARNVGLIVLSGWGLRTATVPERGATGTLAEP